MKKIFGVIAFAAVLGVTSCAQHKGDDSDVDKSQFVTVRDGEFYIGDSVYKYVGTNFWYGPILASEGRGGDRERLARELDSLQNMGVNNLRILVGADGEEGLVAHISPSLQPAPGVYNDDLLVGLDYLLADLEKRNMKAVLYLNNAWEWSGGFSAYLEWAGEGKAAIPAVDGYQAYVEYITNFSTNNKAQELAANHVRNIVGRVNSITGKPYSESPAIMSWQIANEPRAFSKENKEAFAEWIASTASLIKELDSNHLVSTGSEGMVGCELDMNLWTRIHSLPTVDYATIHIWPKNWGWVTDATMLDSLRVACRNTTDYINSHYDALAAVLINDSVKYSKPLVLEEFGYPRDNMEIALGSSVQARDGYYSHVFSEVKNGGKVAGVNFWGWGGLAEPQHTMWEPGDPYTCDPAHESQGLYSVFASDTTTISLIKDLSGNFNTTK